MLYIDCGIVIVVAGELKTNTTVIELSIKSTDGFFSMKIYVFVIDNEIGNEDKILFVTCVQ